MPRLGEPQQGTSKLSATPSPGLAAHWLTPSVRIALIVLLLASVLSVPLYAWKITMGTRSTVARVRAEMRNLATAIETYYIDNMCYPAMTLTQSDMPDGSHYSSGMPVGRTMRARHATHLLTITTPIAYFSSYPVDPFALPHRLTYRYYTDLRGWILGSFGPDRDVMAGGQLLWHEGDIDAPEEGYGYHPKVVEPDCMLERTFNGRIMQPSLLLIGGGGRNGAFTYDPTNGTWSAGDIWRVKQ